MDLFRNATSVLTSPVLTGLERTLDLSAGLFTYGISLPVEAAIFSIDSDSQVTLTKNAIASGPAQIEFTTANVGQYFDRVGARQDVKYVCDERGDLVQFINRGESDINRDSYGSIVKSSITPRFDFRAYPVEFQPSEKQMNKAGLREMNDVIIYTAMQDWINYGVDFRKIEWADRNTVRLQGNTFRIKEKGLSGQFNDAYLYITFGLSKS